MIKQMSLIALGAATLFMAPTVVHAAVLDGGSQEGTSNATVNISDVQDGQNVLLSVPTIEFGKITNNLAGPIETEATKITDPLKVDIKKTTPDWQVMLKATNFSSGGKATRVMTGTTLYMTGEVNTEYKKAPQKPSHSAVNLNVGTSDKQPVLTATDASIGVYTLDSAVMDGGPANISLNNIPGWMPDGLYTSTFTWTLENAV